MKVRKILEEYGFYLVALDCMDKIDQETRYLAVEGVKELESLLKICERSKSPLTIELDFSEDENG